jgi:hypothetical protein
VIPERLTQLYNVYSKGELVGQYRGLNSVCAVHAACRDKQLSMTFDNVTAELTDELRRT